MKYLIAAMSLIAITGCAGDKGGETAKVTDPSLQKLECDQYLFFVNRDGGTSKEELVAFFQALDKSTGFSEIRVSATNGDSKGSMMVTTAALAGRQSQRNEALERISSLGGVNGGCDIPVGPAK